MSKVICFFKCLKNFIKKVELTALSSLIKEW